MAFTAQDVKALREKTGVGMMECKKALVEADGDMDKAVDFLRERGLAAAQKKATRIAAEGVVLPYYDAQAKKGVVVEVNSETDFVAKNPEFTGLVNDIATAILGSNVSTVEEANKLEVNGTSIENMIVEKTATIGEKLSFRRFELVEKQDNQVFGTYSHMGGKIVTLAVLEGTDAEVAKDVAMQAAAMRPEYLRKEDVPAEVIEREKEILKEQAINEGKPADIAEKMVVGRIQKYYKENCLIHQAFVKNGDVDVETYVKNNGGVVKSMIRYEVGEGMEKRNDDFAAEVMSQIK